MPASATKRSPASVQSTLSTGLCAILSTSGFGRSLPGLASASPRTANPYEIKEPKGRRWRKVLHLFRSLLGHVDACDLTPEALVIDYGRLRAEHSVRRPRDPLPDETPSGRYVNPKTQRSGMHGRYTTYDSAAAARSAATHTRSTGSGGRVPAVARRRNHGSKPDSSSRGVTP